MSSIILLQNTASGVTVYLELTSGGPATGITFSDIYVDLKKEGESSFTSKVIDAVNFVEISGGTYQLTLAASDTDTLGNMYVRFTGSSIKTALTTVYVSATAPASTSSPLSISTTALFGYIVDLQGQPVSGSSVSARVLATPSIGYAGTEEFVQSTSLITAKSGSDGFFTISLVTGSEVDIYISAANYRRTLQVPTTSQNIFDIP
jgi:hypothetical protein